MRIATWNVNSVRARLERLLPWLADRQPDVVCLQETKCIDEKFPREEIEDAGYQVAEGAIPLRTAFSQAMDDGKALSEVSHPSLRSKVETVAQSITVEDVMVLCVYVVNGHEVGHPRYDYKLEWLGALRDFIVDRFPMDEKVSVCGDFNVTFDDLDVYDPERWRGRILCSGPERKALTDLCEIGLQDGLRPFHPEGGVYTWWDYRRRGFEKGNRGLRIDHHLLSPSAMACCSGVEVDFEARAGIRPSDHAPVIATLE